MKKAIQLWRVFYDALPDLILMAVLLWVELYLILKYW
jgi:hypothetical protein